MYVSVNKRHEIKEVGITTNPNLTSLYVNDEENPFKGWSEAKICCYKVHVSEEGIVTMMTPYVDSRLIDHFDQVGNASEVNSMDISDTQEALCDLSELTEEQIESLETATCELSEETDTRVSDLETATCELSEETDTRVSDLELAICELSELLEELLNLTEDIVGDNEDVENIEEQEE